MMFAGDPGLIDDPTTDTQETMSLEGILRRQAQETVKNLRTAFPASIIAVHQDQTIDVQPALQVRYTGGQAVTMPPIVNVPVVMPQGAGYRASWPLAAGDTGLVLIADRSLDAWLAGTGGVADPLDTRHHHLADAIFLPGLVPTAKQTQDTGTDMVLGNGQLTMRLKKTGQISVANTAQELVTVLHDSMQAFINTLSALQGTQVLTALGPAPLLASSIAQFAKLQAQTSAILARLDTFKA